jgi:TFIIF-interacting CTD phosphatase-like protein
MDYRKKLLILDLDETLIYATEASLPRKADFLVGQYHVYKRPFLDAFLKSCLDWFEVAVWTSSTPLYAIEIVSVIFRDDELKYLLLYLEQLRYAENIRSVEKRFWRNQLTRSIDESNISNAE